MNRQRQWLFEAPLTSNFNWQIDRELESLNESDSFTSSFKITTRLPESRKFTVSTGQVSVTSSARWDRPSACPIRQYEIRLWRSIDWWPDENRGAITFSIPGPATATWTNLPTGEYYLEIDAGNGNPNCILLGSITVT